MTVVKFNSLTDDYNKNMTAINNCLKKKVVILIWADWCPHCIVMKPEWEKLGKDSTIRDKLNLVEIESKNMQRIAEKDPNLFQKVTNSKQLYYPTITVIKNNKARPYEKTRDFETMKKSFTTDNKKASKTTDKKKAS